MAVPGAAPHLKSGRGKVIGSRRRRSRRSTPRGRRRATPASRTSTPRSGSVCSAPKGTPQAVVDRVNREVRQTLALPDVQKRFIESAGGEAVGMTPDEFLARIKSDAERYKRVVQKAGVKPG